MALTGAMSAGISGLKAHMDALNVVGNNVANVNTQGYKPGRVTFMESIYSTQSAGSAGTATVGGTNPRQTGYGVGIGTIDLDMSSQSLDSTGRGMDCAIQGDGFFLVGDKTHDIDSMDALKGLTLTRVGNFEFRDGYLTVTDDGEGVRPRSATLTVSSEMEGVEPQQVTVVQRSTGANTVVVRAGETRAFPARRTDGAYVKGVAADWVWTTDAELLSGLDYDASRNEIIYNDFAGGCIPEVRIGVSRVFRIESAHCC